MEQGLSLSTMQSENPVLKSYWYKTSETSLFIKDIMLIYFNFYI